MTKTICNRVWLGALTLGVAAFASAQATDAKGGQSLLKARPSTFTKNIGQWDSRALFGGHASGMDFWISKEGFVFQYLRTVADKGKGVGFAGHTVGMVFDGARQFKAVGVDEAGVKQYLSRNAKGTAHSYRKVSLQGIYNKVDALAYYDGKTPRYDFVLHPGASAKDIRFNFKGADTKVASATKLQIKTVLGDRFQEGLYAYQIVNGKKVGVPVSFNQIDATHVGFNVGAYDKAKDLIIDPLVYGTYYGGDEGWDEVRGVCADAQGNVYLTGYTMSHIYPVLYGPFGFNILGGKDAFVSRLTADVYVHDYSALLPGTGDEQGNFIQLDAFGNVWVLGSTTSASFCGNNQPGNMWLVRFAPSASTVLTPFLNGNPVLFRFGGTTANPDVKSITSFSVKPDANPVGGAVTLLMTGACKTVGPTGLFSGTAHGSFYCSLGYSEAGGFAVNAGASGLPFCTGSDPNTGKPFTVTLTGGAYDPSGNFFLSGTLLATGNSDTSQGGSIFQTTPGVWQNGRLQRQSDIWVRKFDANGNLIWSGLVGGAADDVTEGFFRTHSRGGTDIGGSTIATDPAGNVYVLGRSNSYDFPRTSGVFGEVYVSGQNYITVTKIKADGSQILYSTNIRNRGIINASGIGVDARGNVYITGVVGTHADLNNPFADPVVPDTQRPDLDGSIPMVNPIRGTYTYPTIQETSSNDAWLLILSADASSVIRSTYIGGILDDAAFAPFVDPNGDVWVFGWTDTWRYYQVVNGAGTNITEYIKGGRSGGLDPAFITPLAFKQGPEPPSQQGVVADESGYLLTFGGKDFSWGDIYSGAVQQGLVADGISYARDGYVLRFRESLPLITSMTLTPSPIPGGDPQGLANPPSASGTVTLSGPAPAGGATINLTLNDTVDASFQPTSTAGAQTIIIPAGSSTGTYSVYSRQVTAPVNVQVKANYSGNLKTATLQIVPWLATNTINGSSIVGGNSTTATVKLAAAAPTGGVVVNLTTDQPGLVTFPAGNTVTVPAGATSATYTINTNGVDVASTANINATLLGVTRTDTLAISPARITTIVLNPNPVAAGGVVTGQVTLNGNTGSAGTLIVSIQGNPAGYVINPTTVTIPANSNVSNTFTITVPFEAADIGRVVQASRVNGANVVIDGPLTQTLNVKANIVSSIVVTPDTIPSGGQSVATVTLSSAAPVGGARVLVASSNPAIAQPVDANGVPITEVLVPAGSTQTTFNVQGLFALNGDTTVQITAYRGPTPVIGGLQQSANLTVLALTYTLSITPNSVFGGNTAVGTITLSAPAIPGFDTMPVTCSGDPNVTFNQPTFTVGSPTATFTINTPVVSDTETVTFSTNAGTLPPVTATLQIKATEAIGIVLRPSNRVRQGAQVLIQVTVNRNVLVATPGKITFSNPSLFLLPIGQNSVNFVVPVGSNKATVTVQTRRVPRNLTTTVTATCSPSGTGASVSTQLTVMI